MHPLYNPCIPHIFSSATPSCALKLNIQWSGFARSTGAKDFGLFRSGRRSGMPLAERPTPMEAGTGILCSSFPPSIQKPTLLSFIVAEALLFGNKPQRGGQDILHHVTVSPGGLIRIQFRIPTTFFSASTLLQGVSPSQGVCQKYCVSVPIRTTISKYR